MTERIGFIGTGSMGGGMAMRLLEAGHDLTVLDSNPAAVAPLVARGAKQAASPRAVADAAELVYACLPSQKVSEAVALGQDGVAQGRAVKVYVETSTIGPDTMRTLTDGMAAAGIGFLDAPISGGPDGARAGSLSTIVAGARNAYERAAPTFEAFAREVFYIGDTPGQAQLAKLINNMLSTTAKVITFEGVALGLKAGLDPKTLIDFINVSTGRNMATLEEFPDRVLRLFRSRGPEVKSIGVKDTELFLEAAASWDVPASLAPHVLAIVKECAGYGYKDRAGLALTDTVGRLEELDLARKAAAAGGPAD